MKSFVKTAALLLLSVFAVTESFAQVGIEAGYANSRYSTRYNGEVENSDALNGFYVGANYNLHLVAGLSIQPGINYSFLTRVEKDSEIPGITLKGSQSEHYINVPVMFRYGVDVFPEVNIYVFTGPTFSAGLADITSLDMNGKILGQEINGNVSFDAFTGKIKSSNIDDKYLEEFNKEITDSVRNRFDIMYGIGIGVKLFDVAEVRFGYDWGLLNRLKDAGDGYYSRRDMLYAGVTFRF